MLKNWNGSAYWFAETAPLRFADHRRIEPATRILPRDRAELLSMIFEIRPVALATN